MSGYSRWSLSFTIPHQNAVCTSPLPHTCNILRPSDSSGFNHPNNIWWGVQIIKLLTKMNTTYTAKVQCPKIYEGLENDLSLQDEFQEYPPSEFKLVTRSGILNTHLWTLKRHFTFNLTVLWKHYFPLHCLNFSVHMTRSIFTTQKYESSNKKCDDI